MLEDLWALAERQYGLVPRDQAVTLVGERRLDRLVARGRLVAVGTCVYRIPGAPRTHEQRLLGAVWSAGAPSAVATGRSMGWLWGLVDDPPPRPEVMLPHGLWRAMPGVRLVRSVDLTPEVRTVRRGIPTVNPLLGMVELARVLSRDELADVLERGLSLFSMAAMWATLDRYGRPGRNGIAKLREVVANRALEEKPSDSAVEERCAQILRAHGIEGWVFHHVIRDEHGRVVAEPDFAIPAIRFGFEVDGAGKFRERGYLDHFAERRHRVRALGWDLEHFTWRHVVRRPAYVGTTVQQLIADRICMLTDGKRL